MADKRYYVDLNGLNDNNVTKNSLLNWLNVEAELVKFFDDANDNFIGLSAPNVLSADVTYTLPETIVDGLPLVTDASGNLTFQDITSTIGVGNGINYDAVATEIQLGGTLSENTSITTTGFTFDLTDGNSTFTLGASYDLIKENSGATAIDTLQLTGDGITIESRDKSTSPDDFGTRISADNDILQMSIFQENTGAFETGVRLEKINNLRGAVLFGLGESDVAGTGANFTGLVGMSLVPKKYVDDEIAALSQNLQEIFDNGAQADLTPTTGNFALTSTTSNSVVFDIADAAIGTRTAGSVSQVNASSINNTVNVYDGAGSITETYAITIDTTNGLVVNDSTGSNGLRYIGFGETDIDTEGSVDYSSLVFNSLVPKKYVDDQIVATALTANNGINIDTQVIQLGGPLVETTDIDTDSNTFTVTNNGINANTQLSFSPDQIDITSSSALGTETFLFRVEEFGAHFQRSNGSDSANIEMNSDDRITISGAGAFKGLVYGSDFSSLNTTDDRWIVDKGYVDGEIATATSFNAGNGTLYDAINNTFDLGGSLDATTSISGAGFDFSIVGTDTFTVSGTTSDLILSSDLNMSIDADDTLQIFRNTIGRLQLDSSGTIFTDLRGVGFRAGIEYASNYAPDYSDRSLVDRQYVQDYVGGLIDTTLKSPDNHDASGGSFPSLYKGAAIQEGDTWFISVAGTMTASGNITVNVGDLLVANVDGATNAADFFVIESNRDQATETTLGVVSLASSADITAATNDQKAVTPFKLAQAQDARRFSSAFSINGTTPLDITHNLGTEDITVDIWVNGELQTDSFEIRHTSGNTTNSVTIAKNGSGTLNGRIVIII